MHFLEIQSRTWKEETRAERLKFELNATEILLGDLLSKLIEASDNAFQGFEKIFSLDQPEMKNDQKIKRKIEDISEDTVMYEVIRLLNLSALAFENGKLYSNATISYLSMVMVWEALLEMVPWEKKKDGDWVNLMDPETRGKYLSIQDKIQEIRKVNEGQSWIFEAQQRAFEYIGKNTGDAYHHFMKSVLERNFGENIGETPFFLEREHRKKILENNELLFQQYSLFGQVIAASVYWEEMAAKSASNSDGNKPIRGDNSLLPYGIRYYSMMLWLKGRFYLNELLKFDRELSFVGASSSSAIQTLSCTILKLDEALTAKAANAIVNLFRSSQYVIKTHGETSNMILPPLFVVYYNMWEVLFHLVDIYLFNLIKERKKSVESGESVGAKSLLEEAVYSVRYELSCLLSAEDIRDVSSRVLDLSSVKQMALEQFRIVERMGDLSSSDRINILKSKYYLDDDYEDNMFILDWSYCRFYAPGAMVYSKMIEYKMKSLEMRCLE